MKTLQASLAWAEIQTNLTRRAAKKSAPAVVGHVLPQVEHVGKNYQNPMHIQVWQSFSMIGKGVVCICVSG